jgi:ArsR family transcriptional regulator
MAESKTYLFSKELRERSDLFKALSHPARLQILKFLAQTRTCLSGDISDMFPLKRTTLNQHMKELKDTGLIIGHEEGAKTIYCLNCHRIEEMKIILEGFLNDIKLPKDFCCK